MSGYNFNLYDTSQGSGIPDQGNNGLPLVIADANLPTQAVSATPVQHGTSLDYSPHMVESNFHTPATTQPTKNVKFARVSGTGDRVNQKFTAAPQPQSPSLWKTVVNAVVGGKIKTGSSYAASGDYSTQGGGGSGLSGVNGPSAGGGASGGGGMSQAGGSGGLVSPGGVRTQ